MGMHTPFQNKAVSSFNMRQLKLCDWKSQTYVPLVCMGECPSGGSAGEGGGTSENFC